MKPILLYLFIITGFVACKKNTFNPSFSSRATNAGPFADTVTLPIAISADRELSNDTLYILDGYSYVIGGAALVIAEGTRIQANIGSALVVTRGSKIYAIGTQSNPIVFTSNEVNPLPGDWYGILLLGEAPVNELNPDFDNIPGFAYPAGVPNGIDVQYGTAFNEHDNSGELQYIRIEYGGRELFGTFNEENELDGLTCAGVGDNTVIDYIEVAQSAGDAFQFYGGTVNAKHLFAYGQHKDGLDFDLGYTGHIQYAVCALNYYNTGYTLPNGIEGHSDNGSFHPGIYPPVLYTHPKISNLTVVGLYDSLSAATYIPPGRGAWFDKSSRYEIRNSIFMGYPTGFNPGDLIAQGFVNKFRNNIIHAFKDPVVPTSLLATVQSNNNATYTGYSANSAIQLTNPFSYSWPDYRPAYTTNPALTLGSSFTGLTAYPGFFDSTSYRGAFDGVNNWLSGWARLDY